MKIKKFDEPINESVIDATFLEIDKKLEILNEETLTWIKLKIQYHIEEAYRRGKKEGQEQK